MKLTFRSILLTSILAIAGIFGVSSALVNKQIEEAPVAEKAEAANEKKTYYIDVTNSFWGYNNRSNVNAHLWGGAGDVWIYDASTGKGFVTINGTEYITFSTVNYSDRTGFEIYCWNKGSDGNISDPKSFSDFSSGQNLITIGSSGSWSNKQPVTLGKLSCTVTKYAVLDGTVDTANPLGSDTVDPQTTYDVPSKGYYKAEYEFDGWYSDEECSTPFSSQSVTSNFSIYAKYTTHGAWSGTVNVDLKDSGWAASSGNYAIMFMDKDTYSAEVDAWSTYVMGISTNEHLVQISYSIPFEPKKMTVVKYDSSYSKASWDAEKWESGVINHTKDDIYGDIIRIGAYDSSDGKNACYVGAPRLNKWNPDETILLTTVKSNSDHNTEYYSTEVSFAKNQRFKIEMAPYNDEYDYYSNYTAHSSIASNFTGGWGSDITVNVAGTYAIYFNSTTNSIYITTPDIAKADEWAIFFMNNVGCDATGVNLPTGWSACSSQYSSLSNGAKNIVYGATANPSVDAPIVEQAVARYDAALRSHSSLTHFIVNGSDTPRAVSAINVITPFSLFTQGATDASTIIIIIASSVALLSVTALSILVIKKRKQKEE